MLTHCWFGTRMPWIVSCMRDPPRLQDGEAPSFLPDLPRKGSCHRGRMGSCLGLEGEQTRRPPPEFQFWEASTNNWKDNIRETILAGHLSGHSMRTATGTVWIPGSQDPGTHTWSSPTTLRESSVPDAWLESAGHHKSAEMSGRQSSLSGGHAVWRQINLGSVLFLSGARAKPFKFQVLGPRVDCSGESGLCHHCLLGAGDGWAKPTTAQLGLLRRKEHLKEEDRGRECQRGRKGESLAALRLEKRGTDVSIQTDAPLWR